MGPGRPRTRQRCPHCDRPIAKTRVVCTRAPLCGAVVATDTTNEPCTLAWPETPLGGRPRTKLKFWRRFASLNGFRNRLETLTTKYPGFDGAIYPTVVTEARGDAVSTLAAYVSGAPRGTNWGAETVAFIPYEATAARIIQRYVRRRWAARIMETISRAVARGGLLGSQITLRAKLCDSVKLLVSSWVAQPYTFCNPLFDDQIAFDVQTGIGTCAASGSFTLTVLSVLSVENSQWARKWAALSNAGREREIAVFPHCFYYTVRDLAGALSYAPGPSVRSAIMESAPHGTGYNYHESIEAVLREHRFATYATRRGIAAGKTISIVATCSQMPAGLLRVSSLLRNDKRGRYVSRCCRVGSSIQMGAVTAVVVQVEHSHVTTDPPLRASCKKVTISRIVLDRSEPLIFIGYRTFLDTCLVGFAASYGFAC